MKYILPVLCFLAIACNKSTDTPDTIVAKPIVEQGMFEKHGHRGCRGLMPENTIPAMYKAMELGVTNLEMDVAITKDGKVIVTHDPYFNQNIATKPDGQPVTAAEEYSLNMYKMTYDEVKRYDVGLRYLMSFSQQQKVAVSVPLLSDLIDSVEKVSILKGFKAPAYNIEIKSSPLTDNIYYPAIKEYVDLVVAVIRSKNITARVNLSSYDTRALQYIHSTYPTIPTTLNSNNMANIEAEVKFLGYYPEYYSVNYSTITSSLVEKSHQLGMKVIGFTVDDKTVIANLKNAGVNGIVTNYPNLFE